MQAKPFWEQTYSNKDVSTFSEGPTVDVGEFYKLFPIGGRVLDVGCGEGRNSISLAKYGCRVDAFGISENGIAKAKRLPGVYKERRCFVPNYIMDLRKDVGHKPLLMVGASVIVEDAEGRILLQQRTDNHCWGYPGGALELGETLENAARRELTEETGLIANKLELFGVFSGEEFHHIYPNQDEVYIVDVVYLCKSYTGTRKAQEAEVERLAFFSADELPENISPPVRPVIQEWLAKKGL